MAVKPLTAKQKANLPPALQKAIMAKRASQGNAVPKKKTGGSLKEQYLAKANKVTKRKSGGPIDELKKELFKKKLANMFKKQC